MEYTLISFVGTGLYKDGEGYEKTEYVFPEINKTCSSSLFMKALLDVKYRDFNKIILVGTATSGWDMLCESVPDLWETTCQKRNDGTGINQDDAVKIQHHLSETWNIPVSIKFHTEKIDKDTSYEIFSTYKSIIEELSTPNILFDITHGFRSMPILMYQTLQYYLGQTGKNIELIYADFKGKGNPACVRDLSSYWTYSKLTDALDIFKAKLDGTTLAELIKNEWPEGAKIVKRITDAVQSNYSLQMGEILRELKNRLNNFPNNAPFWMKDLSKFLTNFKNLLNENSLAETLFSFSKFLHDHKLNTQAIITLQVAVETFIAEKYKTDNPEDIIDHTGDYDWFQNTGKEILFEKKNSNDELYRNLKALLDMRNRIAHGGGKGRNGGYAKPENFESYFQKAVNGFELLKRGN